MTKTTGELSDILYLLQRTPSPGGRAIRPCADTVAPRALRPEIGPYRRPDFHADTADRAGPSVAPRLGGGTPSVDTMRLDYLDLLLAALASRGLDYRMAGCVQNIDITLPMLGGRTIQLVDNDVVLRRGDVHV